MVFFEASHWPSGHMTRSRPLIGRPPLLFLLLLLLLLLLPIIIIIKAQHGVRMAFHTARSDINSVVREKMATLNPNGIRMHDVNPDTKVPDPDSETELSPSERERMEQAKHAMGEDPIQ